MAAPAGSEGELPELELTAEDPEDPLEPLEPLEPADDEREVKLFVQDSELRLKL